MIVIGDHVILFLVEVPVGIDTCTGVEMFVDLLEPEV